MFLHVIYKLFVTLQNHRIGSNGDVIADGVVKGPLLVTTKLICRGNQLWNSVPVIWEGAPCDQRRTWLLRHDRGPLAQAVPAHAWCT
jgi:hypothetical protein